MNDMAEYIEREALVAKLQEHRRLFLDAYGDFCYLSTKDKARVDEMSNSIAEVFNAPAADVAPVVHGRWEEKFFTNDRQRVCSVCHCTVRQPSYDRGETALFKYCPHCGARMDGDGNG